MAIIIILLLAGNDKVPKIIAKRKSQDLWKIRCLKSYVRPKKEFN